MPAPSRSRPSHRLVSFAVAGVIAFVTLATALSAHDFWLVPNALTFAAGTQIEVLGQSGAKFPTSSGATQPEQVAEARIVGKSSDEKVSDLSVSGKSLRLRLKPVAAGQYVVGVALASRSARTTPARLQRYIGLEGAPELAARYEKDGAYPKVDSVTQISAKFAKTIVEVGATGPRAFDKALGHALELIPLDDPARAKVGESVRVRLLFRGKAVPNVHLRAGWGSPSAVSADPATVPAPAQPDQVIVTGADGVATVAISQAGLWNVRTLYAAAMPGMPGMPGMPQQWEVFFSTMVFSVNATAGGTAPNDSADVVAAIAKFHAALAGGDSSAALALLTEDVAILESGGVETKTAYRSGHVTGDMAYAKAVPSVRTVVAVRIRGDVAWVTSTSVTQGTYRDRPVNSAGAESMVLSREAGAWKISAIHWSSRARRAP